MNPEQQSLIVTPEHELFMAGKGNWNAIDRPVNDILAVADSWRELLDGVERPWLCWNVDPDWCLLQQKLVQAVGWTPVVGSDPRARNAILIEGAIAIDFNRDFGFPTMYPHFPLELVFCFASRLAFWHSDLLIRLPKMQALAEQFAQLPDGEMAAVLDRGGLSNLLNRRSHRYWELIGCTTHGASIDQFRHGCGWWMEFDHHPNSEFKSVKGYKRFYWDYGVGVMQWARRHGGVVHKITERFVAEGHFSRINNPGYELASPTLRRDLSRDLSHNFELSACAKSLGLDGFLKA